MAIAQSLRSVIRPKDYGILLKYSPGLELKEVVRVNDYIKKSNDASIIHEIATYGITQKQFNDIALCSTVNSFVRNTCKNLIDSLNDGNELAIGIKGDGHIFFSELIKNN